MSALVVYDVSTGLVHVKAIAIFVTHVHCAQGRDEVRWPRGKKQVWSPPCLNLRSFGTKLIALKKVLVTLLGFFGISHSDSAPRKFCAPHVTPLTVQYLVETLLSTYVVGNTSSNESKLPKNADCS